MRIQVVSSLDLIITEMRWFNIKYFCIKMQTYCSCSGTKFLFGGFEYRSRCLWLNRPNDVSNSANREEVIGCNSQSHSPCAYFDLFGSIFVRSCQGCNNDSVYGIGISSRVISMWNKYDQDFLHKTNNIVESWHVVLKLKVPNNPNISVLISALEAEESNTQNF